MMGNSSSDLKPDFILTMADSVGGHGSSCEQGKTDKGSDSLVQTRGMTEQPEAGVPPQVTRPGCMYGVCTLLENIGLRFYTVVTIFQIKYTPC
jgi:hypothetical protein